ncbi:hypothetical protein BC831DRAFT_457888 [Entophlyctis helioformis]|nr:hypothetical protein BC831DRAFT_457888 [Entophlyctis helioformis]
MPHRCISPPQSQISTANRMCTAGLLRRLGPRLLALLLVLLSAWCLLTGPQSLRMAAAHRHPQQPLHQLQAASALEQRQADITAVAAAVAATAAVDTGARLQEQPEQHRRPLPIIHTLAPASRQVHTKRGPAVRPTINVLMFAASTAKSELAVLTNLTKSWSEQSGIDIIIDMIDSDVTSTDYGVLLLNNYLVPGRTNYDIVMIDIIWTGDYAHYLADLSPFFTKPDLDPFMPMTLAANVVNGSLVSIPFYADFGLLYYRTDLLAKYGFKQPPQTWTELESMAQTVLAGERAINPGLAGYSGQFNDYEGLTCNFQEWLAGLGIPDMINPVTKEVLLGQPPMRAFLQRLQQMVPDIIPQAHLFFDEKASFLSWAAGNTLFLRSWPYVIKDTRLLNVSFTWNVTKMIGSSPNTHASTLGGWHMAIPKNVGNLTAAVQVLKFLTSAPVQKARAVAHSILPTITSLYNDTEICEVIVCPLFSNITIAVRPSSVVSPNYLSLFSPLIYQNVHNFLIGKINLDSLFRTLVLTTSKILGTYSGSAMYIQWSDLTTGIFLALNMAGMLFTITTAFMIVRYFNHDAFRESDIHCLSLVLAGIATMWVSIVNYIGPPTTLRCILQPSLLLVGFTLTVGTLVAHNWRTAITCSNPKLAKNFKWWWLYLCVGAHLAINVASVFLWAVLKPMAPVVVYLSELSAYATCDSSNIFSNTLFWTASNIFNGSVLLFGIYHAFTYRHLHRRFKERQNIMLALVGCLPWVLATIPVSSFKSLGLQIPFVLRSLSVFMFSATIFGMVFGPKWLAVLDVLRVRNGGVLGMPRAGSSGTRAPPAAGGGGGIPAIALHHHQQQQQPQQQQQQQRLRGNDGRRQGQGTGSPDTTASNVDMSDGLDDEMFGGPNTPLALANLQLLGLPRHAIYVRQGMLSSFMSPWQQRVVVFVPSVRIMVLQGRQMDRELTVETLCLLRLQLLSSDFHDPEQLRCNIRINDETYMDIMFDTVQAAEYWFDIFSLLHAETLAGNTSGIGSSSASSPSGTPSALPVEVPPNTRATSPTATVHDAAPSLPSTNAPLVTG